MASEKDAMGKALQKMLTSLREAEEEVMKYRQSLEKQVQERTRELEENRHMLRTLLGNLQGMAYRCRNDPSWTMEFVSEGVIALTGYHPEDLIGNQTLSYGDLIHPDDRDAVYEAVQDSLSQRDPFILHYRIRTKDNEEKWVWEKSCGIWSEDGTLVALEGFITDITALKRLQQEREQLIEELQKALSEVKILSGLLPICSSCKKIRNDQGYWEKLENYFRKHSDILFTHGICPECMKKLYPDVYEKMQREKALSDT
ncbi:MAG: PAS domain-containing protein [Desulfosoma sp.]|uniref:PAS domain-containing protein n=2 Tax=Desulfosoma sp. TaxID=2603217 RepID=UPI00404B51DE